MKATILPRQQSVLLQMIQEYRRREAARTGLHCSTIIHDIAKVSLPSLFSESDIDEATGLSFQEIGNVIEDIVADGLCRRFPGWSKPPPVIYRGVWCSPDGWSPRASTIDEVKVLWKSEVSKSEGRFLTLDCCNVGRPKLEPGSGVVVEESAKFVIYKMQILFYMAAKRWQERIRHRDTIRGRLHALFVNGNYQPPFPDPITIVLRPTDDEIDANEEMIIQHAEDRGWL